MHMAEGVKVDGLNDGRYDRLLSLTAMITGAVAVIGIVFACLDWSHTSLTVLITPLFNLMLFVIGLFFFFVTVLLWLWLRTHDKRRIRYVITRTVYLIAMSTFAVLIWRFMLAGRL